jgi:hypothetical protein
MIMTILGGPFAAKEQAAQRKKTMGAESLDTLSFVAADLKRLKLCAHLFRMSPLTSGATMLKLFHHFFTLVV